MDGWLLVSGVYRVWIFDIRSSLTSDKPLGTSFSSFFKCETACAHHASFCEFLREILRKFPRNPQPWLPVGQLASFRSTSWLL